MRAGPVSTAAALAVAPPRPWRPARHCPEVEYLAFLNGQDIHPGYRGSKLRRYRVFMDAWPSMTDWFAAPLVERVGSLPGEPHTAPSFPVSFYARPYLLFLALREYITFDYPWMLGAGQIRVVDPAVEMGIDLGTAALIEEAIALGYAAGSARQAMNWTVSRIALHSAFRGLSTSPKSTSPERSKLSGCSANGRTCTASTHRCRTTGTTRPSSGSPTCTSCRWCYSTAAKWPPHHGS
ncbi:hypothetical protein [Streptomyces sp. NBC_00829]|uniref:hypothetical protein n=1 Tax=Streptomyces sp. NBC_00829 TaxID=2903679 RepID=UPI0038649793|nr:hypothetical protein OG293_20600 [Streptomyces sp. NBC_00829]